MGAITEFDSPVSRDTDFILMGYYGPGLFLKQPEWFRQKPGYREADGRMLIILLLTISGLFAYEGYSEHHDATTFSPPGVLYQVEGRAMHLYCTGEGAPTVILDSGIGSAALGWGLVQPEVAKFTRVCSYDRAGYGWSEPGPLPRTSGRIADELHGLLNSAGITGPLVLVGHSFGGGNVQVYAQRHPLEVAGMVLVDSIHERQADLFGRPNAFLLWWVRVGQGTAHLGLARILGLPTGSVDNLPETVKAPAMAQGVRPQAYATLHDELAAFKESARQVEKVNSLGDIPLVVIMQGNRNNRPGVLDPMPAKFIDGWHRLQGELVKKSKRGVLIEGDGVGHLIPEERPQLVVDAVTGIVEEYRSRLASTH